MKKLLMLIVLATVACRHDPFPYEGPNGVDPNPEPKKTCDPDTVYFNRDILPLLQANCAISGCHNAASAQDGVVLTDYKNIIETGDVRPGEPDKSDLYEVITETDPDKRMPQLPASPLAPADIEKVRVWILQGALNNSCDDCDTTNVRYSVEIESILQSYCRSCHSGALAPRGVVFDDYFDVKDAVLNGNLEARIERISTFSPMPPGAPLPDCELETFKIWIENGMPNN